MRTLIGLFLGLFCLCLGGYALISGEAFKIGKAGYITDMAIRSEEPIYYWISALFSLFAGILILYGLLKK